MRSFPTTVEAATNVTQEKAFEHIVPIDLSSIFVGYGVLPAVVSTQEQTGAWDSVGQTRKVMLSDGSSAKELMTGYQYPNYFSYTVSDFSGFFGLLTTSADGEWWFSRNSSGGTYIKWRYVFNARSVLTAPILWFITNVLWRRYMNKALSLSVAQLEVKA